MGIMAGIGGAVGGLAGLFGGGGANNVQLPPMFTMPNMGDAANSAFSGIGGLSNWTNMASGAMGPMGTTFGNLYNNPYAGGFQQGAGVASGMGMNAANNAYGVGGALTGMGFGLGGTMGGIGAGMVGMGGGMAGMANPLMGNAQMVMNTAMDPQSQLYGYLQNQNTQQSQANAAAAGLATSPYGVGLANQSNQLFNMNWENQQLGRQISGLNAYGGAAGTAGGLISGGGGLMNSGGNLIGAGGQLAGGLANMGVGIQNQAPGQFYNAASMPYGTYGGIGAGQNQAIQNYFGNINSGLGINNIPISDYLSYLQTGNTANQTANQTAALGLQQQQQNFNQQMALGGMLGGSMYGLGRAGFPGFQNNFGQVGPTGPGTFMGYSTSPTFGFG